jgi:predicted DNA-binding protein
MDNTDTRQDTIRASLTMPRWMYDRLKEEAENKGESLSAEIRSCIREHIRGD